MTATVARLSQVSHRYGKRVAVEDINLEIAAGRTIGFIGPDGVGKSSVLALISGAREIQSGVVEVLGGDMANHAHRGAVVDRIAYMPQGLGKNLYPTLSVFENVDFFGRLFGHGAAERERRITELLKSTGLAPFAGRPAGKLSGGMKQKLSLCCSLIHDPDLLILDEPTTGVDPLSRRQFWELVDSIRARHPGMSVMVATAYMEEAERFDWLVAMNAGKVLATGTPAEIRSRTSASTLEEAFVALLPESQGGERKTLAIPPRSHQPAGVAIEAHGLTRRFGTFTAVDHVTFKIERGEIFGFLGSNGCGKTTTMKMLTGLLPVTEGDVSLFGRPVAADDLETRKRVGYMSQAFSLYGELTVRQNLELHARLFHLPEDRILPRVQEMLDRFQLSDMQDTRPEALPLGIRQRLSLAVAVIHSPEMLILDEPTSGVDPVARDGFWRLLIDLSRRDGVTIFISTHFMNEAERCDRISLMHAGKVLAADAPAALVLGRKAKNLEDTFIAYLSDATQQQKTELEIKEAAQEVAAEPAPPESAAQKVKRFSLRRLWAYARREAVEIRRDPIRLSFAMIFPPLLMILFSYGISFDVENLAFSVLDHDRTEQSRDYIDQFASSRYFREEAPLVDYGEMEHRLRRGDLRLAIEIPPAFGRDLRSGRSPEVSVWLDAAMPFRAETTRSYVEGVHKTYLKKLSERSASPRVNPLPFDIDTRFRYNQDFKSVYAMVPGVIMLVLALIPAMLTALGVVREVEVGSITNLYSTPVSGIEFLLGKQLPYVAIALINFVCLLLLAIFLMQVPVKGSFAALAVGAVVYVAATTGFGLLLSSFMKTQVAAIFASGILAMLPAVQFSGLLTPVSSLSGSAYWFSQIFPSSHFQQVSIGAFTKALGFWDLHRNILALLALVIIYLALSRQLLRTQEA